ncbi:MAG: hypothetical protein VR64_14355 [Desulfatitalea sp. BRH_c12]|nr:MAG: hypothetical protein VR64_14355 [Desulfatitalea sp. BRH_c12]
MREKREKPNTCIHTPVSFKVLIEQERARVHRSGHHFTLLLFRLANSDALEEDLHKILFPTIMRRIRKIDQLGLYDENHIGLLLPHTAVEGARKLADELYRIVPIGEHVETSEFYVYP